jgi:hypothetical protein
LVQPTWAGGGLTLLGLFPPVLDLPGTLRDVEFVDARTGYALAVGCPDAGQPCDVALAGCPDAGRPCELALATTKDGGETWTRRSLPVGSMVQLPSLIPLGDGGLVLAGGDTSWFTPDDGRNWHDMGQVPIPSGADSIPENGRLWLGGAAAGCVGRKIDVWSAGSVLSPIPRLARLTNQPPMDVCWVAPAPAADGTWWVGGIARGGARTPVVAMSDGRTWTLKPLPAAGTAEAWAQVSTLGSETFATVVSTQGDAGVLRVHGIYRYDVASRAFRPYGDTQGFDTLVGDLVPLLDGRLVAAHDGWWVSRQDGTGFHAAEGSMPWVRRVQRTGVGWVAYDLFQAGWAAWSDDGVTWHKIHVR